jgi:ribosomal protein S4
MLLKNFSFNLFKDNLLHSKILYFSTSNKNSLNYLIYTHLPVYNHLKEKTNSYNNKKKKISFYEKILSFYLVRLGFSFFTQRSFILLEMQLNSFLARVKIIPYFFMARDICFYRLVLVNQKFISNPYFIISLFDTIQLPFFLYQYMSYRNNRYTYLPKIFRKYFFFF